MHFVIVRLVNRVYDFLLWAFTNATHSQRAWATVLSTTAIFLGCVTIVVFDLFELNFLSLRTEIIIALLVLSKSLAF